MTIAHLPARTAMYESEIIVTTVSADGDIEVVGASVSAEQLQFTLQTHGVVKLRDQRGEWLMLYFDMDEQSLIAERILNAA